MEKVKQKVTYGRKSKRAKVAANTSILDPPPPTAAPEVNLSSSPPSNHNQIQQAGLGSNCPPLIPTQVPNTQAEESPPVTEAGDSPPATQAETLPTNTSTSQSLMVNAAAIDSNANKKTSVVPRGSVEFFPENQRCSNTISSIIKSYFHDSYIKWKDVPIGVRDKWFERFQETYSWLPEDTVEVRKVFEHRGSNAMSSLLYHLSETQSSQSPSGEEGASQQNNSSIDELNLWIDIVGGKKKGRVFGIGGAAKLVGNGFCGGSLPKSSFWEKKFEDQVKKTEVMEKQLMVATTRLDEMEKFIRAMQFSLGFEPQNGGTEATESDSTDESSSEDESSEDDEI
ncbi:hypothetical protein Tsubulata_026188 [Turnera subulata]|uniref:Transposase, Ptta/En/Spm, plant n=1 Tax=Turnera subulata TaxID=218843 RepID=A0A9Q0G649_9ROSI|nr:hypothetical protein Tsubulata_026188 [Turnera subulata]